MMPAELGRRASPPTPPKVKVVPALGRRACVGAAPVPAPAPALALVCAGEGVFVGEDEEVVAVDLSAACTSANLVDTDGRRLSVGVEEAGLEEGIGEAGFARPSASVEAAGAAPPPPSWMGCFRGWSNAAGMVNVGGP